MHQAPAVGFTLTRSRGQLVCIAFLLALGFAVSLGLLLNLQTFALQGLVVGIWLAVASIALHGWRNTAPGRLQWDGQQWSWSGFAESDGCRIHLLIDLQQVLLVRIQNGDRQQAWLWLESKTKDPQWTALRRAIVGSLRPVGAAAAKPNPSQLGGLV